MIARKKIPLDSFVRDTVIDPLILKKEEREIVCSYEDHIVKKMVEADNIINDAKEKASAIARQAREYVEERFWEKTKNIFQELESIKSATIEEVESQCCEVVFSCMSNLLDSVPNEEKVRSMINSLLLNRMNDDAATIYVHPDQAAIAKSITKSLSIPVRGSDRLDLDVVVLKTNNNEYRSSFKGNINLLMRTLESL